MCDSGQSALRDTLSFAAFSRPVNLPSDCISPHFKVWRPRELSDRPRGPGASITQLLLLPCVGQLAWGPRRQGGQPLSRCGETREQLSRGAWPPPGRAPQPQRVPSQQEKGHPMTEPRAKCQGQLPGLMGSRTLRGLSPRSSPAPPSVNSQPAHVGGLTPRTEARPPPTRGAASRVPTTYLLGTDCANHQSLTTLSGRQWRLREVE